MLRFFYADPIVEEERLYAQACSEKDAVSMKTDEFLKIFSYKFGVPIEKIAQSEFLENRVLQNILSQCKMIPADININGHARWIAHSPNDSLDNSITIAYPTLTFEQRQEMVDAYNKKYGPIAVLYETYYNGGYCAESVDGILFAKSLFCKQVLPDLIHRPEIDSNNILKASNF